MNVRPVLPEEHVRCTFCGARPFVRCTSENGSGRRPHGDRVARFNGLHPTPRRGWYSKRRPVVYDADELEALARIRRAPPET